MHVDDSACNLASINLMKFRREDGTFDVEAFEHAVDVLILAQEIVVSPSSYPTEEIGHNARDFRQLGLGYANLGALLMTNGLAYDSDEGRALGRRDHRADDRPRLPQVGRGGRGDGPVRAVRAEPRAAQPRDAQAPRRGVRDRRRARRTARCSRPPGAPGTRPSSSASARLPQRAGHGARAHRDDLLPDGLRHHRHRAGLLAGQVQGAGRRRSDDDRQPHRAAGAAARSATPSTRSSRSRRTSPRRARSSAPPGSRTSTCRCSTWPSASARSPHGPHQDDGRGAAVPLGRDLEDGEPAEPRRRSRTSPRPTCRAGSSA